MFLGPGSGASLTFTPVAGLALLVPCRALALVGAHGVDAIPTLAEARDGLALVHVCRRKRRSVREQQPWIPDFPGLSGAG